MNDAVEKKVSLFRSICEETDKLLTECKFEENLQVPHLHKMVITRLNLDSDDAKEADNFIRSYVRSHGNYVISRGAKGGIMLKSVWLEKQGAKEKKEKEKLEIREQIEAKLNEKK